jgi:hypothetical protein
VPPFRASTQTSPVLHDEPPDQPYNRIVRELVGRRGLAWLLFAFMFAVSAGARASADVIPTTDAPIIRVRLQSGNVTIRTWDRPNVQIDGDPTLQESHLGPEVVAQHFPQPYQPMLWTQTINTVDGQELSLAPEPFLVPQLSPNPHDAVLVKGVGDVTITVPFGTALVDINVARQGSITISNYHGAFVAHVVVGSVHLNGVQGTGAVQVNNGPIYAENSSFDRLRARTGRGNMFFDGCTASQIQASSLMGSIIYDNGTFVPGLAHFESERGSVALGVSNGDAQITAHSDAGRVFNEAQGFTRGGPVVTATSGRGAVIYYRGSLREHPRLLMQLPANARPFRRRPPQ